MKKNKNKQIGGLNPHIKGDEFVQDINSMLIDLLSDIGGLDDNHIKPVELYKSGEDIQMTTYANEYIPASFEVKVNNKQDSNGLWAVYETEAQADRQARDKEKKQRLPYSLDAVGVVRSDGKKPLAVIDFVSLIKLYKDRAFYRKAFLNSGEVN
jgi:hypothetical protein